jgi:hypothetical protein
VFVFLLTRFLTAGLRPLGFMPYRQALSPYFFSFIFCGEIGMLFAEFSVESIALRMSENAGSKFDEVTD